MYKDLITDNGPSTLALSLLSSIEHSSYILYMYIITCSLPLPTVCHAELNAILNKNSAEVKGCTLYVGLFPCNECAKLIIQAGIKKVMYVSDKYHGNDEMIASRKLLNMAKIEQM